MTGTCASAYNQSACNQYLRPKSSRVLLLDLLIQFGKISCQLKSKNSEGLQERFPLHHWQIQVPLLEKCVKILIVK